MFNGRLVWLNAGIAGSSDAPTVTDEDAMLVIAPLLRGPSAVPPLGQAMVVLDPGHGGSDTGAIGSRRVYEKKVVLDVAKRVRHRLRVRGVPCRLTREGDYYVSLRARAARAHKWGADVFVSIHINSAGNREATGIETYLLPAPGYPSTSGKNSDTRPCRGNAFDAASMALAYRTHTGLLDTTRRQDRGIRRARFEVLCSAPCPAILVECGFVSNITEERAMIDGAYRERLADGIAKGILSYLAAGTRR